MTREHDKLRDRDGITGCTRCDSPNVLESAHVIPEAGSSALLPLYNSKRLIDFTDHNAIENKILLCKKCHRLFDSNSQQPSWILVPSNLRYFLRHEEEIGKEDGSVPSHEDYQSCGGSRYKFYHFVTTQDRPTLRRGSERIGGEVVWRGSPVAMILKAFAGMTRIPEDGTGLPSDVRDMLYELQRLYSDRPITWPDSLNSAEEITSAGVPRNITIHTTDSEECCFLQWRDGTNGCTLCGSWNGLRPAHVMPAAGSKHLLQWCYSKRLINFTNHRALENKILLCRECHKWFDSNPQQPPGILIPCDLQYFLEYERERSWKERHVPSPEEYLLRRGRYKFYPNVSTTGHDATEAATQWSRDEVIWCGEPVAMLLRAFTEVVKIPEDNLGLPSDVRDTLNELVLLYRTRPAIWPHNSRQTKQVALKTTQRIIKTVCTLHIFLLGTPLVRQLHERQPPANIPSSFSARSGHETQAKLSRWHSKRLNG